MWVYNNKAVALQNIGYYRFIQPNHQKNTGNVCLYVYVCIYDITLLYFTFLLLGKMHVICTQLLVLGSSYSSVKRYLAPPNFFYYFLSHLNVWSHPEKKETHYTHAIIQSFSLQNWVQQVVSPKTAGKGFAFDSLRVRSTKLIRLCAISGAVSFQRNSLWCCSF